MKITYDENKRLTNIEKHGYDFTELDMEFFASSVVVPAKDGRFMAIGVLRNGVIAVVFARLGKEGISIISMRDASRKERSLL
ncbi:BrnT family toxin [Sinorhizobium fredii]|uniref:BrnT family toxin n=1 Tax=Rhizobium fredii TaxID=380 RepID=UPI003518A0A6